jgi:hypothetical protein
LLGLWNDGLIVWDQKKEEEMHRFSFVRVCSIKRVMSTNNYILKNKNDEIILLTINDLELKSFTLQRLLEDKDDDHGNLTESLQVLINPSQIVIATTKNELIEWKYKSSIHLMKIPIV